MKTDLHAKLREYLAYTDMSPEYVTPLTRRIDQAYREAWRPITEKWDMQTVCAQCGNRFTTIEDCQLHIDKFHPTGLMTGETFYERFLHEASDLMDAAKSEETKMSVGDIYREAAKRAAGLE